MKKFELITKFFNYINLESELDNFNTIHQGIEKDVVFKGTNLWILVFAIFIASIGLNMNSTAVIIGAMLISPLMGPINGIGYSIATYNFQLFRTSIKNFGFAVIAGLIASTLYFTISPISTAHSELLARTSPTIYDVLIALFGGLAGIVAISSKQKGNVIPGVAIATALMPPLCTAGYGLATAQFYYFFGAIYLFTINAVFIAISSVIISQILKFPIRTTISQSQKKRINHIISITISLVLIPSIYFGYNLVQQEKFNENAKKYIDNVSFVEGNYLLKHEINSNKKTITLIYGGMSISDTLNYSIRNKAKEFDIDESAILITEGFVVGQLSKKEQELAKLASENAFLISKLNQSAKSIDSLTSRNHFGEVLLSEINSIYPQISSCIYSESYQYNTKVSDNTQVRVVIFKSKSRKLSLADKRKIETWINNRLKFNNLIVYFD